MPLTPALAEGGTGGTGGSDNGPGGPGAGGGTDSLNDGGSTGSDSQPHGGSYSGGGGGGGGGGAGYSNGGTGGHGGNEGGAGGATGAPGDPGSARNGYSGGGGGGGGGQHGLHGTTPPTADVTGGTGGAGGNGGSYSGSGGSYGGGGGGGAGGYGVVFTGASGEISVNINGGQGGNGGAGGGGSFYGGASGGAGGTGGIGLVFTGQGHLTIDADKTITGGTGGNGGSTYNGGTGSNGGNGGVGLFSNYSRAFYNVHITNHGVINGGHGGAGGSSGKDGFNGTGGTGGNGSDGVSLSGVNGNMTNSATGVITGGTGGAGGTGQTGDGTGGAGGNGVTLGVTPGYGGYMDFTNHGVINGGAGGGNGGAGGLGAYVSYGGYLANHGTIHGGTGGSGYISGSGGSGVSGNGATVVNSGMISGGFEGTGARGNAIEFGGNKNRLELWSQSVVNGDVDATASSGDTLALGGEATGAFDLGQVGDASQYKGFEHFDKAGGGTWTVTGTAAFAGNATLTAGTLLVQGSLGAASTMVADGGTLGGAGSLFGDVTVASGGTIAPAVVTAGGGELTVNGDITFASGSTYQVNAFPTALNATGGVTVNERAVVRIGNDGLDADDIGSTQTMLNANGGIAGTFQTEHSFAFIDPTLDHQANAVTLTLARNGASFASVATSQNQYTVAPAIEGLDFGHPLHDAVVMLSEEEARNAFDQLSGEAVQASAMAALIEDSGLVRDVVIARTLAAFDGVGAPAMPEMAMAYWPMAPEGPAPLSAWATAFGGWGESDGDGNAAGLERSAAGFLIGGDVPLSPDLRLGLFAGYSRSSFDADERASSGDSDNLHLGVYGGAQLGALGLRLGGAYAWHDVDTQRTVTVGGFSDSLTATYDASTLQVFGEAGYRLDMDGFSVEPFAGLAHVHLETDAFTEDGGAAALSGDGGSHGLTYTTIGARIATDFQVGDMPARASGAIGWRHALGDITPTASHAFDTGPAFTVAGTPIARDALVIEAGLDLDITQNATFGVGYDGQIGANAHDHALSGTLKVRF